MRSLVLNFFLLVLRILFNLTLNVSHKYNKFFATLSKKSFEFILSNKKSIVAFNLSFILLLIEVELII